MNRLSKLVRRLRNIHRDQSGIAVSEELVSLAVLALAVGIVFAGIYTASAGLMVQHGKVSAATLARSQLELIIDGPYHPDPTAIPYPSVAPEPGFAVGVEVAYWIAPNGPFTSSWRDDGLQQITVSVADADGQILQLQGYKVDR